MSSAGRLTALVRRVAAGDRHAFADLYDTMSTDVRVELRLALSDPADAERITSATFLEVWSLARFHAAPDTDVPAWIAGIAMRRVHERLLGCHPCCAVDVADDGPEVTMPQGFWAAFGSTHDRQAGLALSRLMAEVRGDP